MEGEKGDSDTVAGNLYQLVKAFLKDFYHTSKEGTKRHQKGVFVFLFLFFVVFLGALFYI
jgi:hypothetical protein